MLSVHQRNDSSFLQYRQKVPVALSARAQGRVVFVDFPAMRGDRAVTMTATLGAEVKFSLRTRDPVVAKARTGLAQAHMTKIFESIQKGVQPLDFETTMALAGEVYAQIVAVNKVEPGPPSNWSAVKAISRAIREGRLSVAPALRPTERVSREVELAAVVFGVDLVADLTAAVDALPAGPVSTAALESRFGLLTSWVLGRHGLDIDPPSRRRLLEQVASTAVEFAGQQLKRNAVGDYRPDPMAERFPVLSTVSSNLTFTALYKTWEAAKKPSPNTVMTWTGVFKNLRDFLGHDDAMRLTRADVRAWREHLLAGGRRPKTVNDCHLTALRAVLGLAVRNEVLPVNVAAGVRAEAKEVAGEGALPYDDEEVARLLDLASRQTNPAKRWLPLLATATGARIGELSQLHAANVVQKDGVYCIEITPTDDGGRLKNAGSERIVPLHPEVIAAGFLAFVKDHGQGPLFYGRSSRDPKKRHASKGVANHLGTWIREQGFNNPRKAPAHALRHWWKSAAFHSGMPDRLADRLQGHGKRTVAEGYLHFKLPEVSRFVASITIPRKGNVIHDSVLLDSNGRLR